MSARLELKREETELLPYRVRGIGRGRPPCRPGFTVKVKINPRKYFMSADNLKGKILNWMVKRLESGDDFIVPLKKLHRELRAGLKIPIPEPEEIGGWIEADDRFRLVTVPEEPLPEAEVKRLEVLGYYRGPRVELKSRRPSPAQVTKMLREQTEKLISSLQKAYRARPREGPERGEIEDHLLDLLQQADRIKKDIFKFKDEEEKKNE